MKKLSLILVFITISFCLFSQDFEIPVNYKLDKADDYEQYEKDVIGCVNWLMETPINEQNAKRKEANAFLLKWLSGSNKVHIEIKPEIVNFMDSPDLFMIFMGGWAKYSLESKSFNDKIGGTMAGLELVIDMYNKNRKQIKKDKSVDKYIKLKEKGELMDYVKKKA